MGNASGCFANMDDVKAYASAMKPRLAAEDYELLLYLLGLLENRGLSESVILNGESLTAPTPYGVGFQEGLSAPRSVGYAAILKPQGCRAAV